MSTLASPLAAYLGGDPPTVTTGQLVDHVGLALSRLPAQFRGKPNISALVTALANPCLDLETAFFQMLNERGIETAIGAQLDVIGARVGQPRSGLNDNTYRLYLRARIAANRSSGTVEDLISIINLILADEGALISVTSYGTAAAEIRITGIDISESVATVLIAFVREAVKSGVRAVLITSATDDEPFVCPHTFESLVTINPGDNFVLAKYSLDGDPGAVPMTGELVVDETLATEERVTYSFREYSTTVFTTTFSFLLTSPFVNTHSGGIISLTSDTYGRGWGSSAGPWQPVLVPYTDGSSIGGRLVSARI